MLQRYILPVLLIAVVFAGCENTFTPKAPYEERVVVFSVLDHTAPYQIVRLETTYDAELSSPDVPLNQRTIEQAEVMIASDRERFIFHDTLMTLGDGSQKRVWINYAMKPKEGVQYKLTVNVPEFETITAVTRVPSRAYVQLDVTTSGVRLRAVENSAFSPDAMYFRLWIVGTKFVDGENIDVRREVPVRYDSESQSYVFTEPSRQFAELFSTGNLVKIHSDLRTLDNVSGRDVVATAYSLDQFIYSYYKLVRGFDDPVSVRQDRPDISNVQNGIGIFGAVFADSLRRTYGSIITQ